MPDTKPAGCAGQGCGLLFALLGLALTLGAFAACQEGGADNEDLAVYGFVLGPFMLAIGIFAYKRGVKPGQEAAAIRAAQAAAVTRQMKSCPYCAETILAEARKCKHCGEALAT